MLTVYNFRNVASYCATVVPGMDLKLENPLIKQISTTMYTCAHTNVHANSTHTEVTCSSPDRQDLFDSEKYWVNKITVIT